MLAPTNFCPTRPSGPEALTDAAPEFLASLPIVWRSALELERMPRRVAERFGRCFEQKAAVLSVDHATS